MSLIELLIAKASRAEETEARPSAEAPPFDWGQVFSLLTDLRPAGFGEVLVTEGWPDPEEQEKEGGEKARSLRLEVKLLGLSRRYPLVRYDARHEAFFDHSRTARELARSALVDPYTELAIAFAGQDFSQIPYHRSRLKSYAHGAEAKLQLGRAYLAIGRRKSALAAFQAAARADRYDPTAWWYLGLAQLFSRLNRDALKAFRAAVDLRPGDADVVLGLGLALYHAKDYASAAEEFRRHAGRGAPGAWARSFLACCYRMDQRWPDARLELAELARDPRLGWQEMARQCLACVERGEARQAAGKPLSRREEALAKRFIGVGMFSGIAYTALENLLRDLGGSRKLFLYLVILAISALGERVFRRSIRKAAARAEDFGSGIAGLPCWQLTTWLRPRRPEF